MTVCACWCRVERLTEGEGDGSSFVQWQKNMLEMDLHEELAKIEQRRLEGRISHKEAAIARINIMESNQKATQLKKEEVGKDHSTPSIMCKMHLQKIARCISFTKACLFSYKHL